MKSDKRRGRTRSVKTRAGEEGKASTCSKRAPSKSKVSTETATRPPTTHPKDAALDQTAMLARARMQWQFGDWENLVDIADDAIEAHPQRAELALLVACGCYQLNDTQVGRRLFKHALDWGCDQRTALRMLISGVHNVIACSAALAGEERRALKHLRLAVDGVAGDQQLARQARTLWELGRLGLYKRPEGSLELERHSAPGPLELPHAASAQPFPPRNESIAALATSSFFEVDGKLAFNPVHKPGAKRILINSIPKSGTYLYAKLLEELGAINACVHISSEFFQDFRNKKTSQIIANSSKYKVKAPFRQTLTFVADGQFAVAHLDCSDHAQAIVGDFVHFFCVRDIRNVLVSFMRFSLDPRRVDGTKGDAYKRLSGPALMARFLEGPGKAYLKNRIVPILGWFDAPNITALRFEQIMGDEGEGVQRDCLQRICSIAELEVPPDPANFLKSRVLATDTRTYSGALSNFEDYWNDEVEEIYRAIGADNINRHLGYA